MRNMKLTICPLSTAISGYFFEKEMFDTLIDRAQSEERFKLVISRTAHPISEEYALKVKKTFTLRLGLPQLDIFSRPWPWPKSISYIKNLQSNILF